MRSDPPRQQPDLRRRRRLRRSCRCAVLRSARSASRRYGWLAVLLGILPGTVSAEPAGRPVARTELPAEIAGDSTDAEYAFPTRLDRIGRVLAPVHVNGHGPFRFVLDTGASRSVLSPRLVEELGLAVDEDVSISVHGVTGSAVMPAVRVERIEAGGLVLAREQNVPVLPPAVLAGADGILGIEGLGRARIDIDFDRDRVTIERSRRQRAGRGMLTIPADLGHGGLLMTRARVGRVRVHAIIDTGAERSLGNLALRRALLLAPGSTDPNATTTVTGATPELGEGTSLTVPRIRLGEAELDNLVVTFGDLYVFRLWDLEHEPTLLIGMDLLGTVERLVIDYRRREVQLKPWGDGDGRESGRGRVE